LILLDYQSWAGFGLFVAGNVGISLIYLARAASIAAIVCLLIGRRQPLLEGF
jgi:hypothetical protein